MAADAAGLCLKNSVAPCCKIAVPRSDGLAHRPFARRLALRRAYGTPSLAPAAVSVAITSLLPNFFAQSRAVLAHGSSWR